MKRILSSLTKSPKALVLWSAGIVAILAIPTRSAAQSAPGRFLLSPFQDAIVACNVNGSNCFSVVANGSNHGGAEDVSGSSQPSMAQNGTIAFQAIWSPEGTCIIGGQGICWPHVFVMNTDGTNVRQLTAANGDPNVAGDIAPAISPDGTMVAFVSNRNSVNDANNTPHYLFQIYVVNIDGSGLREVTFPVYGAAGSPQAGNPYGNVHSLAWSPDSRKLAFKESTYGTVCGLFFGFPKECEAVATINVDGTGLTHLATFDLNEAGSAWAIDWSPDGTLIAYAHNSVNFGGPAIAFIDLSGQGRFAAGLSLSQLGMQSSFGGEVCPTDRHCLHFSPDSTKLAYENNSPSDNPAFRGISTIKLDGSGRVDSPNFGQALENGIWWAAGPAFPAAAQLTLAPNPVEVWPGFSQQLSPALLDANSNLIFRTAASYSYSVQFGTNGCIEIGAYALVFYGRSGNGSGSISATNEGRTSNNVAFKCWQSPPCVFSLTVTSENVASRGGSDVVGVMANAGGTGSSCPWRASSNASWITITSGSSGSGNASVNFNVAANSGAARQGTMTIAGVPFTVNQAALATLQSIAISPTAESIFVGGKLQFTATGHYSDGSTQDITSSAVWSSSKTAVAAITSPGGLATGVDKGFTSIKAAVEALSDSTILRVKEVSLESITVAPSAATIAVGGTQQFTATGHYDDSSTSDITSSVKWSASPRRVASVDDTGIATGLQAGTDTITARSGRISGSAILTVN